MMWRLSCSWLATLLVLVVVGSAPVFAQRKVPDRIEYKDQGEPKEHGPPALQYTVAAVSTIIVMVILCMPSRKRNIAG
jgi:heme/copper-type cytochrome/quinol oxidase subunit 2